MAAVLYDVLHDDELRATMKEEHEVLAGLLDQYLANLRTVYSSEIGMGVTESQR